MSDVPTPRMSKLPFWIADGVLIAMAAGFVALGSRPLGIWEMTVVACCGLAGAWVAILPHLREYEAAVRLAETDHLSTVTARLGQLDQVAERIAIATSQWQGVQDRATQTAGLAKEVVDRLAREAESFAGAVLRTADGEKQTLRLEAEKLRRAEGEWLQAVGRVMDHVFALHVAALRSGQPGLIEQMDRFHAACREALRRVGFLPIVAAPDESFDPRKHQAAEGSPQEGEKIDETLAPGFVFQGRLVRPVIVRMIGQAATAEPAAPANPDPGASPETADPGNPTGVDTPTPGPAAGIA